MTKLTKNQKEIDGIRKSCRSLAQIMAAIAPLVKPGAQTGDLEKEACRLMKEAGGRPAFKGYKTHKGAQPFPSALCISINEEIVHGPAIPSRVLREGDIVGIDVGMNLHGYFSDMARTIAAGRLNDEADHLLKVTWEALNRGLSVIKPGHTLNDIGTTIQKYVEGNGLSVVRDLVGHGVGLAVHEDPQIPHYDIRLSGLPDMTLRPGMVLAIEPMVNTGGWEIADKEDGFTFVTADGSLSAQFEDTVLVTEDGHEILTRL